MPRKESDYIIVGAGAAGCVIASRLTEEVGTSVTLLEAGGSNSSIFLRIPGLSFLVMLDDRYNWNFDTEPVPGFQNRSLRLLAGKVLGGSSSINGLVYTRGHSTEFDLWRQMGCEGWSSADVLPYFKKAENSTRGVSEWHGTSGPLRVRRCEARLPIIDAFLGAMQQCGYPLIDDFNVDAPEGFGMFDLNVSPKGQRVSTAAGYLEPALSRPNLTLQTGVLATRVVIENGRAKGVVVSRNGVETTYWARREVILSTGGIKSPHLLMLSGIGPADQLRRHGVEVLVDSPQVGQNYQNHILYSMQYSCSQPVTSYKYVSVPQGIKAGLDYLFTGRGVLTESPFGIGGFFRTDPRLDIADIQVVLSTALVLDPGKSDGGSKRSGFRSLLPNAHGFALFVQQGTPYSRGSVGLKSADPLQYPAIFPNYLSDPRDLPILLAGVKRMRDAMRQAAISHLIEREITPGPDVRSDEDLAADIRRNGGTVFHQSGTCVMGSSSNSVVDPQLRVRGVESLRIADNSIIPVLPNSTPHALAIMIGEKAADLIKASAAPIRSAA
jgi:choline dehydrogenase